MCPHQIAARGRINLAGGPAHQAQRPPDGHAPKLVRSMRHSSLRSQFLRRSRRRSPSCRAATDPASVCRRLHPRTVLGRRRAPDLGRRRLLRCKTRRGRRPSTFARNAKGRSADLRPFGPCAALQTPLKCTPVEPKPPLPRSVSGRVSTTSTSPTWVGVSTSCAKRVPASSVNGSLPKWISKTFTSPR